jgi:hypothetical protein
LLVLVLAAAVLHGCSSGGPVRVVEGPEPAPRSSRNVIARAEIESATHNNALELVQTLRPAWLTHRGQESMALGQGVDVYVDGVRQDRNYLARLPLSQVDRLEFLSPSEATFRFGTQQGSGAIIVATRRRD